VYAAARTIVKRDLARIVCAWQRRRALDPWQTRRLNRDHIARLSRRFHVSPSVFFGKM
jgi:hypothetical protein